MSIAGMDQALRQLLAAAAGPAWAGRSDGELLRAFVEAKQAAAFAEIVRRHGPMVLGVCWRALGELADAEDAFQATFLLLVRKGAGVRSGGSLGAWLHGVARRVAADARRAARRRAEYEGRAAVPEVVEPAEEAGLREVCRILDEEIGRLPARCQEAFVLCCLEGISSEAAAARLGLAAGTVRNRVSQARGLLQERLARRGVSLGAALGAGAVLGGEARAVPAALREATVRAAGHLAAGGSLAGGSVGASVAALVSGTGKGLVPGAGVLVVGAAVLGLVCALVAAGPPRAEGPGEKKPVVAAVPGKEEPGEARGKGAVDRYGDPLPRHALARLGTVRFRAEDHVARVAVVPRARQIVGELAQGSALILWDAESGREVRRFAVPAWVGERPSEPGVPGENGWSVVLSFAVSGDGKRVAAGTGSFMKEGVWAWSNLVYDRESGRKVAEWAGRAADGLQANRRLAFVGDGVLASLGGGGTVRLWDVAQGREVRRLEGSVKELAELAASPDGRYVFGAGGNKERWTWVVWEAASGRVVRQEDGRAAWAGGPAVSLDGSMVTLATKADTAGGGRAGTEIRLFAGPKWHEVRRWRSDDQEISGRWCSMAFSPDGRLLAGRGMDGAMRRWEVASGRQVSKAPEPSRDANDVAFLDAETLVTANAQALNLWDVRTGQPRRLVAGSETQVTAVALAPDGRHAAVGGGDATVRVWDVGRGTVAAQLRAAGQQHVLAVAFTPDGRQLVAGDFGGVTRVWDWAAGGEPVRTFWGPREVRAMAVSPDGARLATGDAEGVVRVWDLASEGRVHKLRGRLREDKGTIYALVFAPGGGSLFSGGWYNPIRKWDIRDGREVWAMRGAAPEPLTGLALSPGGRWLYSGSADEAIRVWDAETGRLAGTLHRPNPEGRARMQALAVSPDGKWLAAGVPGQDNKAGIHLWDLATGKQAAVLEGHTGAVWALAFGPGGRLVSGSFDTTALVWNVGAAVAEYERPPVKELDGLWQELGAADPAVAYRATMRGAAAGDVAVTQLRRQLRPARRVEAAAVAGLVAGLDAVEPAGREQAAEALAALGPAAEPALRAALERAGTAEAKRGLEGVLGKVQGEQRRQGLALEVLEMVGTEAARGLLEELAGGVKDSRLTREASEALGRSRARP